MAMTEREARAKLLMPGPEPCCERPFKFRKFRYDRSGLVTAAVFGCWKHRVLWTPDDEARREAMADGQ